MTVDRTISFELRRIADLWVTEISYVPEWVVALWEGPQLLPAKVKDADGQDWYISLFETIWSHSDVYEHFVLMPDHHQLTHFDVTRSMHDTFQHKVHRILKLIN